MTWNFLTRSCVRSYNLECYFTDKETEAGEAAKQIVIELGQPARAPKFHPCWFSKGGSRFTLLMG